MVKKNLILLFILFAFACKQQAGTSVHAVTHSKYNPEAVKLNKIASDTAANFF